MRYVYLGAVSVRGLRGYLWVLGRRVYFKSSWRGRDTRYLGTLDDLLGVAARLARLAPAAVDVRALVAVLARALGAALYLARRCRGSPRWRFMPFEVEALVEEAVSLLSARWPLAARIVRRVLGDG